MQNLKSALPASENKFLRRWDTKWPISRIPTTHKCLIYMSDSLRRSVLLFLLQGYISKWWGGGWLPVLKKLSNSRIFHPFLPVFQNIPKILMELINLCKACDPRKWPQLPFHSLRLKYLCRYFVSFNFKSYACASWFQIHIQFAKAIQCSNELCLSPFNEMVLYMGMTISWSSHPVNHIS